MAFNVVKMITEVHDRKTVPNLPGQNQAGGQAAVVPPTRITTEAPIRLSASLFRMTVMVVTNGVRTSG